MALSREQAPPTLFVLRALGLGDLLTAVPALRGLRSAFPGHELVLGMPADYEPVARLAGVVDRVCPMSGLSRVPRVEPCVDVAVNLHGRGPQSHRLLEAVAPGRMIAFARAECGNHGPQWRADEHEVSRWCRLVAESLQVEVDPDDLALVPPATPSPVPGAVVVHPGAAHPARRWPAHRFADVVAWAAGRELAVVVTGSADERELACGVAAAAGLRDDAVLAGRLTLSELAALVVSAKVVVAGDTGVAHLATAYRTPSVILFGPTPPSLWGPPAGGPHTAVWHGTRRGDPWGPDVDAALLEITAREVIDAVEGLLSGESTRARLTSRP